MLEKLPLSLPKVNFILAFFFFFGCTALFGRLFLHKNINLKCVQGRRF